MLREIWCREISGPLHLFVRRERLLTNLSERNPERVTYSSQGCEPLGKGHMIWGTLKG